MPAEFERKGNGKNHHVKIIIFLLFLGILGSLVVSSLYPIPSMTGKFVDAFARSNSAVRFTAELTIPEIKLTVDVQSIEFK